MSGGLVLAVSTSSPWTSVAWFDGRRVVWSGRREAARAASGAVAGLVQESGIAVGQATGFVADLGPGSFTGVKVGVTMAKMWAMATGGWTRGVTAFDLIARGGRVAVPSKRGEVFWREPDGGMGSGLGADWGDAVGYGPVFAGREVWPDVAVCAGWWEVLEVVEAARLSPVYIAPPSVSLPKQSHIMGETFR